MGVIVTVRKISKRAARHLVFWLTCYILALLYCYSIYQIQHIEFYIELFGLECLQALFVYTNLYGLIPRLLLSEHYFRYLICLWLLLFCNSVADISMHRVFMISGSPYFYRQSTLDLENLAEQLFENFSFLTFTMALKFLTDLIKTKVQLQQMEHAGRKSELNFLKSQVQPHFFFNTLNNLYSLILNRSSAAPEVVLKLAALMRYMIYDSKETVVSLNDEIAHLNDFISIERLRFGKRLAVRFTVNGATDEITIPPMLLIIFIENCFKHASTNNRGEIDIDISISVDSNNITFKINNTKSQTATKKTGGLGLEIVRKRLDILYKRSYELTILPTVDYFFVTLKLPRWNLISNA